MYKIFSSFRISVLLLSLYFSKMFQICRIHSIYSWPDYVLKNGFPQVSPLLFPGASTNISRLGEITMGRLRMHAISEFFGDTFTNDPTNHLWSMCETFSILSRTILVMNIHYFLQSTGINYISFPSFVFFICIHYILLL